MRSMYGNSIDLMSKSLDYLWAKQSVTANNLANVETVGYKAQYVTFENTLKEKLDLAIGTGNKSNVASAINGSTYSLHTSTIEGLRLDGNNVNADVETAELTMASLQYDYSIQMVNSDITRLRTAIKGQ